MWFKDLFKTEVNITPYFVPSFAKVVVFEVENPLHPDQLAAVRDQVAKYQDNNGLAMIPAIVVDSSIKIRSLSDDDLRLLGLMRIPEQIPDIYSETTCKPILDNE